VRFREGLKVASVAAPVATRALLSTYQRFRLMESLDALREPDTQAIVLAIASIILAWGCCWIASLVESRQVGR
jgi:hypothetical protein